MYKLIVMFRKPTDEEAFDHFYYEEFLPMSIDIDGLERLELTKANLPIEIGGSTSTQFELQVEFYFQTKKAFQLFMGESEDGERFQTKLADYSDAIYTVAYGQTEVIGRSEIIARYNEHLIRSFSNSM